MRSMRVEGFAREDSVEVSESRCRELRARHMVPAFVAWSSIHHLPKRSPQVGHGRSKLPEERLVKRTRQFVSELEEKPLVNISWRFLL